MVQTAGSMPSLACRLALLGAPSCPCAPITPGAGAFNVWLWPSTGMPVLFGLDVRTAAKGVVVHKPGAAGSSAASGRRGPSLPWRAALGALSPNRVRVLLGPNDQTGSTPTHIFGGYNQTVIDGIRAALLAADILIMMPPENQRANNASMAA